MSEPYLGQIKMFGGNFAPRGWAFCNGQILPINQNQSLYSLLGTTYGGDGRTSFGLPDLRGRTGVHEGDGVALGAKGGTDQAPTSNETKADVAAGTGVGDVTAVTNATGSGGGRSPYLGITYIIATQGLFPPRN